jgi:hypothetical protein
MKKVLFTGCSYTAGIGFDLEKQEPGLWVNLLHQNTLLKDCELINAGIGGRSNAGIFQDTVWNLTRNKIDYAFVSWTSLVRYQMSLGLELYNTDVVFLPNGPMVDHNLNDIKYTKTYLENIRDRFTTLPHDHLEIVNLLFYVNSLLRLATIVGTKIFFINAMCPWDNNYFTKLKNVFPNSYTDFTKKIINIDNRNDEQIFQLYDKIHHEYDQSGNIQSAYWLNLYNSLKSQNIDTNNDGVHPGIKSNKRYFEVLQEHLTQKLKI